MFCSDPAEAQKVINKVTTEKGVPYIPTESKEKRGEECLFERSKCLHYGPVGGGVYSRRGPYKSVGVYSRKGSVS